MKVPRPRVRTVYRAVGLAALAPLLLSGLVPVAVAAPEAGDPGGPGSASGHAAGSAGQADSPAPVQILDLTTSGGQATDIAQSGLDDARPDAGSGASGDARPDAGSGTSGGARPDAGSGATGDARPGTGSGTGGDAPHGPEASTPSAQGASGPGSGDGASALPALATGGRVPSVLPTATDPQADAALLTDPLQVDRFLVAGFTWAGGADLPEGVRIYLRVRENGTWSPWYLNEAADSGRDDRETAGTGEFVTGGADAVQASVVGSSLPAGLKLVLVPSQPQGEEVLDSGDVSTTDATPTPVVEEAAAWQPGPGRDEVSGDISGPAALSAPELTTASTTSAVSTTTALSESTVPAAVPATVPVSVPAAAPAGTTANGLPVPVTTRAEWGANPSYMSWDPDYEDAGHVVVHHTAGTNNYSAGQSASIVRGIYYYHAVTLDWGDIGYNFLIDKYGTVFEGRSGSLAAPAGRMSVGAHARGVNTGTMGLSMMGDYSSVSPSDAQLSSVGKMAGWFLRRAGITDANGWAGLNVWTTERYQAGSTISMPRILGHRDVGYTSCPGNVGYSKLGTIRTIAQQQISGSGGWKAESGAWYYLKSDGAKATGWVTDAGNWYYLDASKGGAMVTGRVKIDGRWSTFAAGGAWQGYEGLHPVLAEPTASREQVIATMVSAYNSSGHVYPSVALSKGGADTAQSFFTTLYDEAVAEGVSPELLFAQVMKETAWLQFGGDVAIGQFNFGGLGATGGGAAGASFSSVQIGLRAQVQHLRAYADSSATPQALSRPLVDPRFTYVRKGSAAYVEHLGIQENPQRTGWATARNYGNDLASMIDQYFG